MKHRGTRVSLVAPLVLFSCLAFLNTEGAAAETVSSNFEAPTFKLGSVRGQDGWTSAAPGEFTPVPNGYDQGVVANPAGAPPEFGGQSLRLSNGYASGSFEGQTRSNAPTELAGENLPNLEYIAQFSFISYKPLEEQPELFLIVSPDNGLGARMSYFALEDRQNGIRTGIYDVSSDGNFHWHDFGILPRDKPHTIKFWIRLVPGSDNDYLRVLIDGEDQGQCFTTWESAYRAESQPVPDIGPLEFRASYPFPALLGAGFLFDNVSITTRKPKGEGPPTCDLPIEKEAETHTVRPGGRVRYRITVHNRGHLGAGKMLVCDRIPKKMTFVSADHRLLGRGRRRCLFVPHLAPGKQITFHPVLRLDANAQAGEVEDNVVEEIPGTGPGEEKHPPTQGLPPGAKVTPGPPAAEADAKVKVVPRPKPKGKPKAPSFTG